MEMFIMAIFPFFFLSANENCMMVILVLSLCLCSPANLDLPLLTVTPCGQDLCVDPRPPVEHLRAYYDIRHYTLRIQSNNANNAQVLHIDSHTV